ncbi:PREDICTED: uncharacterized protein LOC106750059 [Dinoponera quadriceps]|uniref:Uncharacterized protein LOC106750059 n=1 Tax=Dinoponera quadriceps TaxID=609295 RepID=A0A6P3Y6A3_DINQU|nr:PREDICTED: uncharacterized protein LOC106750059 [Dinoponera quadriceps]
MTRDADRIQRRYPAGPEANPYPRATDVSEAATRKSSLEEEHFARNILLFPERRFPRFRSASYNRSGNLGTGVIQRKTRTYHEEAAEDTLSERPFSSETRPIHARDIKDRSVARKTGIRASIEEYLRNYIDGVHRSPGEDEAEVRSRDAASEITDVFASLDIEPLKVLYEDLWRREKQDEARVEDTEGSAGKDDGEGSNVARIESVFDGIQRDKTWGGEKVEEPENDGSLVGVACSKQSAATSCEDDAFIKTGLNVIPNKGAAGDKLSRILRSEYLRKDLLL